MSESIPAHDLKVSSWNLGCDMSEGVSPDHDKVTEQRGHTGTVEVEVTELLGSCSGIIVSGAAIYQFAVRLLAPC